MFLILVGWDLGYSLETISRSKTSNSVTIIFNPKIVCQNYFHFSKEIWKRENQVFLSVNFGINSDVQDCEGNILPRGC